MSHQRLDMVIREARGDDAAEMSRVIIASIAKLCRPDHGDDSAIVENWTANKSPGDLARWHNDQSKHMYVADCEGEILCVGAFNDAGEIQLNYIAPKARFSGISKSMLGHLEDEMRARGMAEGRLTSTETAHRFYLSAGWTDMGAPEEMFGTRCYPMAKRLA